MKNEWNVISEKSSVSVYRGALRVFMVLVKDDLGFAVLIGMGTHLASIQPPPPPAVLKLNLTADAVKEVLVKEGMPDSMCEEVAMAIDQVWPRNSPQ